MFGFFGAPIGVCAPLAPRRYAPAVIKPTIEKCIVDNFVVSICLGTLAVVQVTSAESTLIVSILSIA